MIFVIHAEIMNLDIAILVYWYISTVILKTITSGIVVKIHAELCQFTRIRMTGLYASCFANENSLNLVHRTKDRIFL